MRDPKWIGKIALGVLFSLIPIINFAVAGWAIEYVHDYSRGGRDRMPEWTNFAEHWTRGIAFAFASWVYYLPAGLILIFGSGLGGLSASGMANPSSALASLLGTVGVAFFLAGLYMVAASFLVQAARANYAVYGVFGAAFRAKEILARVGANFSSYLTAWAVGIVAVWGAIACAGFFGFALSLVPIVGWIVELLMLPVFVGLGLTAAMISSALVGEYAGIAYAAAPATSPTSQLPTLDAAVDGAPSAPIASPRIGSLPGSLDAEAGSGRAAIAAAVARATPPSGLRQEKPTIPPMVAPPAQGFASEEAVEVAVASVLVPSVTAPIAATVPDTVNVPAALVMPAPQQAPEPVLVPAPASASEPTPVPQPEPAPVVPGPGHTPVESAPAAVSVRHSPSAVITYQLRRESGPGASGETWNLPVADVRIGRDESCFVSLVDGKASRVHAVLTVGRTSMVVSDAGSSNGTFVNDTKLSADGVRVAINDIIRIGDTLLLVREVS